MYCGCGCGKITNKAKSTARKRGRIKGQHYRYAYGHSKLKSLINYKGVDKWVEERQEKYLCQCGCEQFIVIKSYMHGAKGIPQYISGHLSKTSEFRARQSKLCSQRLGELSTRWVEDRNQVRDRTERFTKRQKRDIYLKDEGICQHCKIICLIDVEVEHPWKVNFDHIIAIEDGGENTIENGQILCLSCHKLKHSVKAKRVNCGKPRTGNPQPSLEIANRLKEGSETRTEETIMSNSALLERDEIVQAR